MRAAYMTPPTPVCDAQLPTVDSAFMFTYAGGSFVTGMLGDRFSPTAVVGIGLLGSSLCLFLITVGASFSSAACVVTTRARGRR